jgi:hypothetical protein
METYRQVKAGSLIAIQGIWKKLSGARMKRISWQKTTITLYPCQLWQRLNE